MKTTTIASLVVLAISWECARGFGQGDKVLLSDIQTLTLHQGGMTNGRRSAPVPQLNCVGGSAKSMYNPQVVQCYNRGFDGYDVQWECKADMDNAYRFGDVVVTCEGNDHSDDPYVLRGSCGLEYTLELTKEGYQQQQQGGGGGYQSHHNSYSSYGNHGYSGYGKKASSVMGDLVALAIVALIIYGLYRMFVAAPTAEGAAPGDGRSNPSFRGGSQPPPPGFRSDYMPGSDSCSGSRTDSSSSSHASNHGNSTGMGGGGFWTGAATGGLMGYLFGSRGSRTYTGYNQPGYGHGYQPGNSWWGAPNRGYSSGWGSSGWGSSGWGSGGGRSSGGGFSTGTRTASGFGGTRRR